MRFPPATHLVVLAPTRARVVQAKARTETVLEPLGLRLHPDKTRIACLAKGQEGFVFLGFEHRMRESRKWRGRWYLNRWPSPRAMTCYQGQGQTAHGSSVRQPAAGGSVREPQPRAAGLRGVLRVQRARTIRPEVGIDDLIV